MTKRACRFLMVSAWVVMLSVTAGCAGNTQTTSNLKDVSGVIVKGRLVQGGKPLKVHKDEQINITFISTADKEVGSKAEFNPEDSSFVVNGPTGKGLPPGSYKIGLSSERYDGGEDRFNEKFDLVSSPLVAEIGSGGSPFFEIDLATKRVKQK